MKKIILSTDDKMGGVKTQFEGQVSYSLGVGMLLTSLVAVVGNNVGCNESEKKRLGQILINTLRKFEKEYASGGAWIQEVQVSGSKKAVQELNKLARCVIP